MYVRNNCNFTGLLELSKEGERKKIVELPVVCVLVSAKARWKNNGEKSENDDRKMEELSCQKTFSSQEAVCGLLFNENNGEREQNRTASE